MTTAILVVPTEQRVGLTTVALGLVHALDREGIPVGFCKPVSYTHLDVYKRQELHIVRMQPCAPSPLRRAPP